MMQTELEMVKSGAAAVGLKLVGNSFIGYRFVPRSEVADFADEMLIRAASDTGHLYAWCEKNKDVEYSVDVWNSKA